MQQHFAGALVSIIGVVYSRWWMMMFLLIGQTVEGHNLGDHALSGADPKGSPSLPAIEGPFTVELNVEFQSLRPSSAQYLYQTIFEYSGENDNGANTIWFGQHRQSDELAFYLTQGDEHTYCYQRGTNSIEIGVFMKLSFGIDRPTNKMWIRKNGVLVVECSTSIQLADQQPHTHRLLGNDAGFWAVDPLVGSISGVKIMNHATDAPKVIHTMSHLAFQNLPGQMYGNGFVASFYARFDAMGTGNFHRVFDFGNGVDDSVWCGGQGSTSGGGNMACEVHDENGIAHRIVAPNSIQPGQFAFWHFGVDADGTFWMEKDGELLVSEQKGVLPKRTFRRHLNIAKAQTADGNLNGVVLGLRVDSVRVS